MTLKNKYNLFYFIFCIVGCCMAGFVAVFLQFKGISNTMIGVVTFVYFEPVISFVRRLTEMTKLNADLLAVILKSVGIGILGELAGLICSDAGNAALSKTIQMLTTAVILWLSIPLFESLLDLVQAILGEL